MARLPDPQHVYLDALLETVSQLVDDEIIDRGEIQYLHDEAPESHVFTGDDLDGFHDIDEAAEIVNAVGSKDLQEKISYWSRVIENAGTEETE